LNCRKKAQRAQNFCPQTRRCLDPLRNPKSTIRNCFTLSASTGERDRVRCRFSFVSSFPLDGSRHHLVRAIQIVVPSLTDNPDLSATALRDGGSGLRHSAQRLRRRKPAQPLELAPLPACRSAGARAVATLGKRTKNPKHFRASRGERTRELTVEFISRIQRKIGYNSYSDGPIFTIASPRS
jgi:hypothetical protein